MGVKLKTFFDEAGQIGGIAARVALARYTTLASKRAIELNDSPEMIQKFEKALQKIRAEFKTDSSASVPTGSAFASQMVDVKKLRNALTALERDKQHGISDLNTTIKRVTEMAAKELNIARVSVWFLENNNTLLECIDLFDRKLSKHSSGLQLVERDYPTYFVALKYARAIDAYDANTDPRTSCFSESYLRPLGIVSMLDIPIWHKSDLKGVLCQEHIGARRRWTYEEADFGVELTGLISQALE
ncbi:multi-sensor signal transduction histidine kinase [Candidatus Vecturithrix granuli]|uniref:Multi-sensor signal transduction histidine kinase n=1 Tax=Vecturithrix granuli TaxID=1499967 RepID=A0A081C7S0_VECG1|nr:multi-sensor signal transduction histidine kinase [Candidatus Vecturithrix granuli]